MPISNVTVHKLLISCPSDVSQFVPLIENTIHRFNRLYGIGRSIMLLPVYYEHSSFSAFGDSPQAILNKQIVDSADMAISVFWNRFGCPTKTHDSGTEEEIGYLTTQGKQVFLYFLQKDTNLNSKEALTQKEKLLDFKDNIQDKSKYTEVQDENALCKSILDGLIFYFNQLLDGPRLKSKKKKSHVLWVDDHPENNVFGRQTLEQYGVEVHMALSTEQALNILHTNEISLIISDMGRKEGPNEGYVLLEKVREEDKDIPYFIFAGSSDPLHTKIALRRGAQGSTNDFRELFNMVIKALLK